jgi:hypothetical protein
MGGNEEQEGEDGQGASGCKEIVVACMQKVDQLGRLLATQRVTNENAESFREQTAIQQSLQFVDSPVV